MIFAGSVDGCDFVYAVKVESDALERCKFVFVDFVVLALFVKGYAGGFIDEVFARFCVKTEFCTAFRSVGYGVFASLEIAVNVCHKAVSVFSVLLVGRIGFGFFRKDREVSLCRIVRYELICAVCVVNRERAVRIFHEFRADEFFFRKVVRATLERAVYILCISHCAGFGISLTFVCCFIFSFCKLDVFHRRAGAVGDVDNVCDKVKNTVVCAFRSGKSQPEFHREINLFIADGVGYFREYIVDTDKVVLGFRSRSKFFPELAVFVNVSVLVVSRAGVNFRNGNFDKFRAFFEVAFDFLIVKGFRARFLHKVRDNFNRFALQNKGCVKSQTDAEIGGFRRVRVVEHKVDAYAVVFRPADAAVFDFDEKFICRDRVAVRVVNLRARDESCRFHDVSRRFVGGIVHRKITRVCVLHESGCRQLFRGKRDVFARGGEIIQRLNFAAGVNDVLRRVNGVRFIKFSVNFCFRVEEILFAALLRLERRIVTDETFFDFFSVKDVVDRSFAVRKFCIRAAEREHCFHVVVEPERVAEKFRNNVFKQYVHQVGSKSKVKSRIADACA